MILVTGVASVSDQWRIITVCRRTQRVSSSLIAGVLRRMSATGCDELGILGLMAVSTAIAGVCGVGRMTIPAVAFCQFGGMVVIAMAYPALCIHRRNRCVMAAYAFGGYHSLV